MDCHKPSNVASSVYQAQIADEQDAELEHDGENPDEDGRYQRELDQ
jgi:hypothetical protein